MNAEVKNLIWCLAAIAFIAASIVGGMAFIAAFAFR
jgi:hypothetical protein